MPAVSKAQQAFAGAELARRRAGKETRSDMETSELRKLASAPTANLPERARPRGSAPFTDAELAQGYRRLSTP